MKLDGICQQVIDNIGQMFEDTAKTRGLDFKCLKDNRDYVEFTGSDKICTFKMWYQSEMLSRKIFLKVQMNFVEKLCYPLKNAN